jgi:hypothetical protein
LLKSSPGGFTGWTFRVEAFAMPHVAARAAGRLRPDATVGGAAGAVNSWTSFQSFCPTEKKKPAHKLASRETGEGGVGLVPVTDKTQ